MQDKVQQQLAALAAAFLAQLPARMEQIDAGMRRVNDGADIEALQAVRDDAHKLAGAGATFGQAAIGEKAKVLENACDVMLDAGATGSDRDAGSGADLLIAVNDAHRNLSTTAAAESAGAVGAVGESDATSEMVTDAIYSDRVIRIISDDETRYADLRRILTDYGFVIDGDPEVSARIDAIVADTSAESAPEHHAPGAPPVIFLGDGDGLSDRLAAVHQGGAGFLAYPVEPLQLIELVNSKMDQHRELPIRVLLIDDEPAFCAEVQDVLGGAGMTVLTIQDAQGVFQKLETFAPDIIAMNTRMPTCSGIDLTLALGLDDRFSAIPVLFISADIESDLVLAAANAGGVGFVRKPVDSETLVSSVTRAARLSAGRRGDPTRDSLTGAFNHTYMMLQLGRDVDRVRRAESDLTYAVFSVDHFSALNHAHGHEIADQILRRLVTVVSARIRRTDSCGRLAGAKFGLILPDATMDQASQLFDFIRGAVADFAVLPGANAGGLTISGGMASYPANDDPRTLSDGAEQAARAARRAGGDRVVRGIS